ncbi:hypothetical protein G6011_01677 [Alternaria panax]|uniref:Uncharacterized protein n=1 Tax=Alternaria panax TaxID=48097 RepID=A0AAD4IKC0_9PLEO|nr:hypothetical protein G6011_01677 [Alternaria panax]
METSIRVQVPARGWKTFCLEFHLAYLIPREVKSSPAGEHADKSTNKSLIDLVCLGLQSSSDAVSSQHCIQEANISIVVCGWSNTGWTGYAFANTGTKTEEEEVDDDDLDSRIQQDFLAAENGCDNVVDANSSEYDARKYWLRVLAIRCELKCSDLCLASMGTSEMDAKAIRKSSDRTIYAMQLLRTLRDSLSMTLRAYRRFDEFGGDNCYFSDMVDPQLGRMLDLEANRLTFESIQLNRETNKLNMRSHDLAIESNELTKETNTLNAESHELNMESHRLNKESNQLNLESNQLNKDSNRINMDNHDLSERTHKLNQRTSVLSNKMREINDLSMNAALANRAAAAKTSRSTRVNVELLLFTTPLQMVLQYFDSEKDIFVLMVILRLFTLLFEHAHSLLKIIPWKKSNRSNEEIQRPSLEQSV